MKVLVQYIQAGKYKDQAWEALAIKVKGEVQAVTPSYAVRLIEQNKAILVTSEDEDIIIHA